MFDAQFEEFTRGDNLLLKIENDRLVLSDTNSFSVKDIVLGLSQETQIESFRNRFRWLSVTVSKIDNETITFNITNFHRDDRYRISSKSYNTMQFKKVVLESGNTDGILAFAERIRSVPQSSPFPQPYQRTETKSRPHFSEPKAPTPIPQPKPEPKAPINVEKTIEIPVPFDDVQFFDGYASSAKSVFINELNKREMLEFNIENDFLREEFNDIKPYFSAILQIKQINVTLNLHINENQVIVKLATSEEISKINEDLIEQVPRLSIVRDLLDRIQDDNAHPVSEILDNTLSKTFKLDETKFFDTLINEYSTKHSKHLQYLSSSHNSKIIKLRFYNNPTSFLFCVGDEKKHHFVWETFTDSLGTYIWSFDESENEDSRNSLRQNLISVESVIKEINATGRNPYIRKRDANFSRIQHTYNDAGFEKWKKEIEATLSSGDDKS